MKMKKILFATILMAFLMLFLTGCSDVTIRDGSTGVVVEDGVVKEFLTPGRYPNITNSRTDVITINNKVQGQKYSEEIEGQSSDNVIINVSNYSFSYRIGGGEKSVWLVKNVSDIDNIIPQSLVENALKEALINLEAKKATDRRYLEPLFKEILQKRINEYLDYHDGEDTTLITVTYVSIGNLSPEEAYDKELSRAPIELKKIENDRELETANIEASIANAEAQNELARLATERLTASWDQISEKLTPEMMAYLIIEKWDGHYTPGSSIDQLIEFYINEAMKDSEQEAG